MEIVIDKSYLQATPGEEVRLLCEEHTVLFTETLLYELLTTDELSRRRCFDKLPQRDNPVLLMPRTGPLLRYEIEKQRAASPIVDHRVAFSFCFNPRLGGLTFQHSAHEVATLEQWQGDVESEVLRFHETGVGVAAWCPSLKTVFGQELKVVCEDLKKQACVNIEVVRMIYRSISPDGFPCASLLDPSWALFRWVQSHLLFELDYLGRYGFTELPNIPKRVEHDVHDMDYVIFGALCGALATKDVDIANNFLLSCPEGKLLS